MTISEQKFEEFCKQHFIDFLKIPREQNKRTPDYEIYWRPSFWINLYNFLLYPFILSGFISKRKRKIIVEIKQIEPNNEDIIWTQKQRICDSINNYALMVATKESIDPQEIFDISYATGNTRDECPGERVRSKIDQAKKQLSHQYPNLLVLYNLLPPELPDPLGDYNVICGIFGLEQIKIEKQQDRLILVARKHGPQSRLTENHNTRISAVAVLRENSLIIYNNPFAKKSFSFVHSGFEIRPIRLIP